MPLSFASPIHLLLLLLVPLIWLIGRRSLSGLGKTRRRLALFIRSAIVVVLALALAELRWRDQQDTLEVAFLVDRSRSVPEQLRRQTLAAVNRARRGMDPVKDRATLIVFGRRASIEQELSHDGPPIERIRSTVGVDHSDLGAAIDYAINAFSKGVQKRIVLFSDGNETKGSVRKRVAEARDRGIVVDVVPLSFERRKEVLIEKIVLPNEVKVGEPYQVRVVIRSYTTTTTTLELYEEGELVATRKLDLRPGLIVETFPRVLRKAGFFDVRALLRTKTGQDQVYQNNQAFGFVYVRGESKVLYVSKADSAPSEALLTALAIERVNTVRRLPAELPKDESQLQAFDALILDDIPKYELTLSQQRAIERAVKNMGMGLVMIGGPDSFGAGSWEDSPPERTPIERALPVNMEPKQKTVMPNGALAIIMHSCEFPQGNDWGRKVTKAAIDSLSAKDYVGVVFYGMGGSEWRFRIQRAKNKRKLKRLVDGMQPGDMPDFDASMRMAINGLKGVKASLKHMIILSDGDPSAPASSLLKTARDSKITISTIAIQPHSGPRGSEVALMKRIASATGGKFYYLTGPQNLPKIFIKETRRVARPLIRNIRFVPRVVGSSPILKGFAAGGLPALLGHVLAEPKKTATVALDTPEKESMPVLVHWRYGVGKTVAFTSDVTARWAPEWIAWPGFSNFWGQLLRWTSKEVQDSNLQVSTKVQGDEGRVLVYAVDEEGEFLNGLTISGVVTSPDSKEKELSLRQVGPGQYEGKFPAGDVGTYTISLLSREEGSKSAHSFTTGMVSPYSEEYKPIRSQDELLSEIAASSGGRVLNLAKASSEDVGMFDHDVLGDVSMVDKWPLMLMIALALFPLDVFVRRVMLDYDKIADWFRVRVLGRVELAERDSARVATLDRLKARKAALREGIAPPAAPKFEADDAETSGDAPVTVAGGAAPEPSGPEAPGSAPPVSEKNDEAQQGMSRLLQAKRRALDGYAQRDDD